MTLELGREKLEKLTRGPGVARTRLRLRGREKPAAGMLGPAWAGWADSLETRSLGDYGAEFRAQWDSEYSQIWLLSQFSGFLDPPWRALKWRNHRRIWPSSMSTRRG